jgi:hypothetical protein
LFIGLKNDVWLWVAGIEPFGFIYEMVSLCISRMTNPVKFTVIRSQPGTYTVDIGVRGAASPWVVRAVVLLARLQSVA